MTDLRKLAKGKPCMIRLPGCDGGGETTVLAHFRMMGICGVGQKPPDTCAAWSCYNCHDLVDGRRSRVEEYRTAHLEGVIRTLAELDKLGIKMEQSK